MSHMVYAAASFCLRGAKPRKLKCCIYKMHRLFLQIRFIPFMMWRGEILNAELKRPNKYSFGVIFFLKYISADIYNSGLYVGVIWVLLLRQPNKRSNYLLDLSCRDMWKMMAGKGERSSLLFYRRVLVCGAVRMDLSGEKRLSFMKTGNTNCQMDLLGSLLLTDGKIKMEIKFEMNQYIGHPKNMFIREL